MKRKTRTYTGVADHVKKRLALHNAGRVKASQEREPEQYYLKVINNAHKNKNGH